MCSVIPETIANLICCLPILLLTETAILSYVIDFFLNFVNEHLHCYDTCFYYTFQFVVQLQHLLLPYFLTRITK